MSKSNFLGNEVSHINTISHNDDIETQDLVIKNSENENISINISELPNIIGSQIDAISDLEKRVKNADESAERAMKYVSGQMGRYVEKGWGIFKHRSGNTKDIIEDTQEAVEKIAKAQAVSTEAIRQSFEFQKKLADTSRYLFMLGCANIAANRTAVRTIERKLKNASQYEISELARQEMLSVVRQLKEQEDILKNQEEVKSKLKEKERVDAEQSQRLEELGALLENKDIVDQKQERAIETNKEDIGKIKGALKEKDELDADQSSRISKNEEAIKLIYDYMKQKDELDKKQSDEIEKLKTRKRIPIAAIIISVVAIIIGLVNIAFAHFP